jgi:predicted nucleic acid-binding protein
MSLDAKVRTRALDLERQGLKPLDALHVACAELAVVTHFLTCDDRLVRRYSGTMRVLNPVDFVLSWSEGKP